MEFIDNTGHIFSLPSYSEEPIGYEYEENPYTFWIDSNKTSHLSVNTYYSRVINMLFEISEDEENINEKYSFNISIDSNIYTLLSSAELHDMINEISDIRDYIDIVKPSENIDIRKKVLTNDDLLVIKTHEPSGITTRHFLLIPIYVLGIATDEGTWSTNVLVHITNNETEEETWTHFTVGGTYISEHEELYINGRNMGVNLPHDILRAVYQESFINDVFNEELYNIKLKEYLVNYMAIRGECGNFKSAIDSLKWFGWGDKLSISKLLKTDNEFQDQYILDYFNLNLDILNSFNTFRNTTYIAVHLALNHELDEYNEFEFDKFFWGENKPKLEGLLDKLIKKNTGYDLDISTDREKYWYWAPYFDFTFNELGLKLACLKYYYEKYFLPIHIKIHDASMTHLVFANDIKLDSQQRQVITAPSLYIGDNISGIEFLGNGVHYFTKQIHWVNDQFNEFNSIDEINNWYIINDTCVNIPIKFNNDGYYNCVLLLEREEDTLYKNVIYFNTFLTKDDSISIVDNDETLNLNIYKFAWSSDNINYSIWYNGLDRMLSMIPDDVSKFTIKMLYNKPTFDNITINGNAFLLDEDYNRHYFIDNITSVDNPKSKLIYESHFAINQNNNKSKYANFIIYPKMLNIDANNNSRGIIDWVNKKYKISLLVNNRWYYYEFILKIPEADIEFGTLQYKYWLNDNNYILHKLHAIDPTHGGEHNIMFMFSNKYLILEECNEYTGYRIVYGFTDNDTEYYAIQIDEEQYNNLKEYISKYRAGVISSEESDNFFNILSNIFQEENDDFLFELEQSDNNQETTGYKVDIENFNREWNYIDFTNRYMSNFGQISYLSDSELVFNSYMHDHRLVDTNNINWDIDFYKIIKYNLDNNLKYIDGRLIGNSVFAKYITTPTGQHIYIHNDMFGQPIVISSEILQDGKDLLIFKYGYQYFVLEETGKNNSIWAIYSGDVFMEEDLILLEDSKDDLIEIDSEENEKFILIYDSISNKYIDKNGETYTIYERLHNTIEEIYGKYIQDTNIVPDNKYLNSLHLFNLCTVETSRKNILIFNNYIDMTCNGIGFQHDRYTQFDDESLKFWISGTPYKTNKPSSSEDADLQIGADTNEPDIYSLYWNNKDSDIHESTTEKYVYYIQRNTLGEDVTDPNKRFTNALYTKYEEPTATQIVTGIFSSLDNFNIGIVDEIIPINENDICPIYSSKEEYQQAIKNDPTIQKALYNDVENDCWKYVYHIGMPEYIAKYNIVSYVKNINGEWKDYTPTVNEFKNRTIKGIKIRFKYNVQTLVKNRVVDVNPDDVIIDGDNIYTNVEYNGNTYKVNVYNSHSIIYYDHRPIEEKKFQVRNQNPAQYWDIVWNDDTNEYEAYNTETGEYEPIDKDLNILTMYWNDFGYQYKNYLVKSLKGNIGTYELSYETGYNNDTNNEKASMIKLKVAITDENGNRTIIHNNGDTFELTGTERDVTAFFQIEYGEDDFENVENYFGESGSRNYWIKPHIYKIKNEHIPIPYIVNEQDNNEPPISVKINDNIYEYGMNSSKWVIDLYNDFFNESFVIYDICKNGDITTLNNLRTIYESIPQLDMYLDYDFYIMHDNQYWYGVFISRQTCDNIRTAKDLVVKNKEIYIQSKQEGGPLYALDYIRSDKQMLINRMEYISSNGINHFNINDIIVASIYNNDRLPINMELGSKWDIIPVTIGHEKEFHMNSNSEMTILPINDGNSKYIRGYYDVIVRYCLDRDNQYQWTKKCKIRID